MMLKDPLFKILSINAEENSINAILEVDEFNEIFSGHFPGQPIVPGACMLQILKEILQQMLNTPLQLIKADNIKFLSLVDPGINKQLQLTITYQLIDNEIKLNANLMAGEVVCMKLQGAFQKTS